MWRHISSRASSVSGNCRRPVLGQIQSRWPRRLECVYSAPWVSHWNALRPARAWSMRRGPDREGSRPGPGAWHADFQPMRVRALMITLKVSRAIGVPVSAWIIHIIASIMSAFDFILAAWPGGNSSDNHASSYNTARVSLRQLCCAHFAISGRGVAWDVARRWERTSVASTASPHHWLNLMTSVAALACMAMAPRRPCLWQSLK
mmetsp:Transcript_89365/g.253213  ORF Transcript_89365/g.253213 Transcript_89365/m.253213 type:complete len:204 (+) Transcript_89365:648-1259(+)